MFLIITYLPHFQSQEAVSKTIKTFKYNIAYTISYIASGSILVRYSNSTLQILKADDIVCLMCASSTCRNFKFQLNSVTATKKVIPVDPAGGCCYWGPIKPCKSSRKRGRLLSNTSIIYP